jgi:hypothetical protein
MDAAFDQSIPSLSTLLAMRMSASSRNPRAILDLRSSRHVSEVPLGAPGHYPEETLESQARCDPAMLSTQRGRKDSIFLLIRFWDDIRYVFYFDTLIG